ncbi:kinase-like domain-containing protein [Trametes punicea]|nr:kinase-like domain-containing protein [Trametes punicea]
MGTWVATDGAPPPDEERRILLRVVQDALSVQITRMDLLAKDGNLVVLVEYEDGKQDVVRSPRAMIKVLRPHAVLLEKFWLEVNLLKWLRAHSSLPVPDIHHVIAAPSPDLYPYAVMEKMPGELLMNAVGRFPFALKERLIHAHAQVFLELFRLEVPQVIGSLDCSDGVLRVVPRKTVNAAFSATRVYDTLEDFVSSLIETKLGSDYIGTDDASRRRGEEILLRLQSELLLICKRLDSPSYRRCVLTHDDLNQTNILVSDEGDITGIVDWEYQSVRPAVLAASYPGCIRYDGVGDPQFASENTWWTVSPQEAASLRELFAEIVKAKDREYWEALVEGQVLRQAMEWLYPTYRDDGCKALEAWMDTVFVRN